MKKIIYLLLILFSSLSILSGCKYSKDDDAIKYYGQTSEFVVMTDGMNYFITDIASSAYGKSELTLPDKVTIKDKEINISKIDIDFSKYKYLKKIIIEFDEEMIDLKNCENLEIVQINSNTILYPETFLEGIEGIDVYIINPHINYEGFDFAVKNNIHYEEAPNVSFTSISNDEKKILFIDIILILIGLIIGIFVINNYKYTKISKNLAVGLVLLLIPAIYAVLFIFNVNYLYLTCGLFIVIPTLIIFNYNFVSDNNIFIKLLYSLIMLLTFALGLMRLYLILPTLDITVLTAALIVLSAYACIQLFIENKFSCILIHIIYLIIGSISIYLTDVLYLFLYKNTIGAIIGTIIQIVSYIGMPLLFIFIFYLIYLLIFNPDTTITPVATGSSDNSTSTTKTKTSYPYPNFGFDCVNIKEIPNGCVWTLGPNVFKKPGTITISGIIEMRDLDSEYEFKDLCKESDELIQKNVNKVMRDYFNKYPEAPGFKIKYDIKYKGEYDD